MPNQPNTPEYNAYWSGGQNPNAPLVLYYPDTVPSTNAAVRGGLIDIDTVNETAYISIKPGVWAYIGGAGTLPEIKTLTGDSGGAVGPDDDGNLNILGTAGQITVTGTPGSNTLTLALAGGGGAVDSFTPDTGTSPVVPTAGGLVNVKGQSVASVSGIRVTGATNELDIAMFSPFVGDFSFTKSSAGSSVTLSAQHTGANTALISSTANSSGNGAGFFSSGQYDSTKFWNFGMTPTNAGTNPGGYNISYNSSGQSDPSAGTPTLRIDNTGGVTIPAGNLDVVRSNNAVAVTVQAGNTSNTAGSGANFVSAVTGTSGGDAYSQWTITNAPSSYCMGIDNSDSDKLKMTYTAATSVNPSTGTSLLEITPSSEAKFVVDALSNKPNVAASYAQIAVQNQGLGASASSRFTCSAQNGAGDTYIIFDPYFGGVSNRFEIGETQAGVFKINVTTDTTTPNMSGNTVFSSTAAGAITFNSAYTFPTADGSAGQTLVTNGAGLLTFQNAGSTGWTAIGASQTLAVNEGYLCTTGGALSLALPAVSAVGDEIEVALNGSTSWTITQPNGGSRIRIGTSQTTLGVGGSLASTGQGDSIRLVCVTASATWMAVSTLGNITVV
jgi:hypothetical protein